MRPAFDHSKMELTQGSEQAHSLLAKPDDQFISNGFNVMVTARKLTSHQG